MWQKQLWTTTNLTLPPPQGMLCNHVLPHPPHHHRYQNLACNLYFLIHLSPVCVWWGGGVLWVKKAGLPHIVFFVWFILSGWHKQFLIWISILVWKLISVLCTPFKPSNAYDFSSGTVEASCKFLAHTILWQVFLKLHLALIRWSHNLEWPEKELFSVISPPKYNIHRKQKSFYERVNGT